MTKHDCPYRASNDIGVIDVMGKFYSVGCRTCGPQKPTLEDAERAWNGLCLKLCTHCISRAWGRALAKRVKEMAVADESD